MSTEQNDGDTRVNARIEVCPFEAGRPHFVLFSSRDRLLLRSGPIEPSRMRAAIDEFQRHCGIRAFYRLRGAGRAWAIELRSAQNRLLAVNGNTLVDEQLAAITIQLAIRQGPFARIVDRGDLLSQAEEAVA